jgi:uncharacterized membrane protein (UPF0127 family)
MKVIINNIIFNVKACFTPQQQMEGMQGKRFDDTFNGMLFFMNTPYQSFWMKGCVIPLDIIIIDDNVITTIHRDCQPCRTSYCKSYQGVGNLVLELEGGSCENLGITEGDSVYIEF